MDSLEPARKRPRRRLLVFADNDTQIPGDVIKEQCRVYEDTMRAKTIGEDMIPEPRRLEVMKVPDMTKPGSRLLGVAARSIWSRSLAEAKNYPGQPNFEWTRSRVLGIGKCLRFS